MRAIVFDPPDWHVAQVADPELPGPKWVKLRVLAVGICGSDVAKIVHRQYLPGYLQTNILGHEICATVIECGSAVRDLAVGDRVAVEPLLPCCQCPECARGLTQFCPHLEVLGRTLQGGFAEILCAHRQQLHRVSGALDRLDVALADPLATVVHAFRVIGPNESSSGRLVVIGDGPIGLLCCRIAALSRFSEIILIRKYAHTAAVAATLGATRSITIEEPDIAALADSADVVLEAVGGSQSDSLRAGITLARPGGILAVLGVFAPGFDASFAARTAFAKELRIVGLNSYTCPPGLPDLADALALIDTERVCPRAVVTHVLSFDQCEIALELLKHRRESGAIKIVLRPQ